MKFRPCIDLHNGAVKQIVGSTLDTSVEDGLGLEENFTSSQPASHYASLYSSSSLTGGHIIKLGPNNDDPALLALQTSPQTLQIGGGITSENAAQWINAGATHVIVTSYVFSNGVINYDHLNELVSTVGKDKIVLDLSCRRKQGDIDGPYYVVTDRWQKYTDFVVDEESLKSLSVYADEFLVHGVENEGKRCGILEDLVVLLKDSPIPVTYAGGVRGMEDLERVKVLGEGKVDLTIGSALDIFGGDLKYEEVVEWHKRENQIE